MASIKKRGKTWYVRFSKRETQWDPETQSMKSVLKQKSKGGFKTKKEAIKAANDFINDDNSRITDITFEELWNNYKDYIVLKQKKQSFRKTISKFNNHILSYFKNYKVKNITASVYIKWQSEIEKKGFKHKYN